MMLALTLSSAAFATLLVELALAPPVVAAAAGGSPGDLTVAQKEQATGRFLRQLSDLGECLGLECS